MGKSQRRRGNTEQANIGMERNREGGGTDENKTKRIAVKLINGKCEL